jgi:hypothetical protein
VHGLLHSQVGGTFSGLVLNDTICIAILRCSTTACLPTPGARP